MFFCPLSLPVVSISHDDSLFPPTLSEARCLLHGCLDSEGQEDLSLESRPIMHQVLLLRRVRSAGAESGPGHSYHYRLESRLIAVGCTCVRPIIQHQQWRPAETRTAAGSVWHKQKLQYGRPVPPEKRKVKFTGKNTKMYVVILTVKSKFCFWIIYL